MRASLLMKTANKTEGKIFRAGSKRRCWRKFWGRYNGRPRL